MSPSKDTPSSAPAKIAIKGFSLSSKSSTKPGAKPAKPPPSSHLGKRSRSTFIERDSDNDSDGSDGFGETGRGKGRVEVVSGFEDGGAVRSDGEGRGYGNGRPKGELVIPKLENKDWRGEARGRKSGGGGIQRAVGQAKNLLPPEVQAAQEAARKEREGMGNGKQEGVDVVNSNDGEIEWGLSVRKRVKVDEDSLEDTHATPVDTVDSQEKVEEKPKTADEEALAALLGEDKGRKGSELVISSTTTNPTSMSDVDAYKLAIASAPEASTLEDYERVPVEEFGAALLRGMGWKGESHGKVKDVKRRQNLLGLGARELKEAEELGAWVQKSDVKRLNPGASGGGDRRGERKPKASEYRREEERRREKRDERGGGSYRREKERDRDGYRDRRR